MKYQIQEVRSFTVCGIGIKLTEWQNKNDKICREFWIYFNSILSSNHLHQYDNWRKYAFTYKEEDQLYYFCAIPERFKVPGKFIIKTIPRQCYLIYQHNGDMAAIKNTIKEIYNEFLPKHKLVPDKTQFFHFERYDNRFYWDSSSSVIDICVPVTKSSAYEEVGEVEYGFDI